MKKLAAKINVILRTSVVAFLLAGCSTGSANDVAAARPLIEIATVAQSTDSTARSFPAADGAVVRVVNTPLVALADIKDARVGDAEGEKVLEISLKPSPAARVRAYSAGHVGNTQMAFIVNGEVRKVVKILDPIEGDGIIVGPMSEAEGKAIADAVNSHKSHS